MEYRARNWIGALQQSTAQNQITNLTRHQLEILLEKKQLNTKANIISNSNHPPNNPNNMTNN